MFKGKSSKNRVHALSLGKIFDFFHTPISFNLSAENGYLTSFGGLKFAKSCPVDQIFKKI